MEFKSNLPIYLQVIDDIKKKIITGTLPLGTKLPSSRELAIQQILTVLDEQLTGMGYTPEEIIRLLQDYYSL